MVTMNRPLERADRTIPTDVTDKTVVLMNPPADPFAGYLQFTRAGRGEPRPARLRWLATGANGVELVREDASTLRVRQIGGFEEYVSERMLRSPRHALAAGQRIDIAGMHIEMLAFDEARIRFDVPLEDPSLVWLRWQAPLGYVPATPPPVGERLSLPPIDVIAAAFDKHE
jgi:hypothetical protein